MANKITELLGQNFRLRKIWRLFSFLCGRKKREHLTYAMSINAYSRQKLEHLQLDHKEK
jgi:hypothetical protein